MTNYVIKHTDPANGSFAVEADQVDGTISPWSGSLYVNPVSGLTALSSSTSLVLAGRGITDYGELIQNNLLYLMENFAYSTRPLTPVQGQLWYKNADLADVDFPSDPTTTGLYMWDSTEWKQVLLGGAGGAFDALGQRVINVADAISATDAMNRQASDVRYLKLAGGTVTGATTFSAGAFVVSGGSATFNAGVSVSVVNAPTLTHHVVNKGYLDSRETIISGALATEITNRTNADIALNADITAIEAQIPLFLQNVGDTMLGTLTFDVDSSIMVLGGGLGQINMGLRRLQQVGTPTLNADAATKLYVDSAISDAVAGLPPPGGNDGVVYDGFLDSGTGILTLNRTEGLPDVVISGDFAPFTHSHLSSNITFNLGIIYSQSTLTTSEIGTVGYPVVPLYDTIRTLDQQLTDATRPVRRKMLAGDGVTATFALGSLMVYSVNENKLQVYKDGVKQYANERGRSTIVFTGSPLNPSSSTGLSPGVYTFNVNVNGAGNQLITVTATSGYTYLAMAQAIAAQFVTHSVPATVNFDQYYDRIQLHIDSNTTGNGSSVVASYLGGELFTSIATSSAPINTSITVNRAYFEVGNAGSDSSSITFTAAPAGGTVIEVLLFPG